jgi:hypothetical protein
MAARLVEMAYRCIRFQKIGRVLVEGSRRNGMGNFLGTFSVWLCLPGIVIYNDYFGGMDSGES